MQLVVFLDGIVTIVTKRINICFSCSSSLNLDNLYDTILEMKSSLTQALIALSFLMDVICSINIYT